MKLSPQDWKKILPGILVSLVCLAILAWVVNPRQFIEALKLADYRLVVGVYLATLLWLAVRTIVWRTILQEKASYSQVFFTLCEGYLLNNLLPLRLGEVGRAFLLGRKARLEFLHVLSTIVIERSLDIVMAAGLLLSTLPFVVGASWARSAALGAGGVVLAGLVFLYVLAHNQARAVAIVARLTARWPAFERFGSQQLTAFLSGLTALTDTRRFLTIIAWMIVNWGISVIQYYTLLRAFFPQVKLLWATFTISVVALGAAAPSSPGAIGVLEASMTGALALFGLDHSTALATAITSHLCNYLITGVLGLYALGQDGLSLGKLFQEVKTVSDQPAP